MSNSTVTSPGQTTQPGLDIPNSGNVSPQPWLAVFCFVDLDWLPSPGLAPPNPGWIPPPEFLTLYNMVGEKGREMGSGRLGLGFGRTELGVAPCAACNPLVFGNSDCQPFFILGCSRPQGSESTSRFTTGGPLRYLARPATSPPRLKMGSAVYVIF